MIELIIAALLPIVVTLMLGFVAGWHHDFDAGQGAVLNRMVMLYALPLTLFAGMMGLSRSVLLSQGTIALILLAGMAGGYLLVFLLARLVFRQAAGVAALLALAIAGPAVPFVGVPVLGHLYGTISTLPIALCSIIMNLFQVPLTLLILSSGAPDRKDAAAEQETPSEEWRFDDQAIAAFHRAQRLQRELELDWPGIAVALSLLDRIDRLDRENRRLSQRLLRFIAD